jgi:hypothetical protein
MNMWKGRSHLQEINIQRWGGFERMKANGARSKERDIYLLKGSQGKKRCLKW